mmetsp:Transcript_1036/g.3324  ORF Transcript_1036/g.3324 Transcript_1036/m.3324 type:complete len:220 (+) Transcript_1036:749-1408(+)
MPPCIHSRRGCAALRSCVLLFTRLCVSPKIERPACACAGGTARSDQRLSRVRLCAVGVARSAAGRTTVNTERERRGTLRLSDSQRGTHRDWCRLRSATVPRPERQVSRRTILPDMSSRESGAAPTAAPSSRRSSSPPSCRAPRPSTARAPCSRPPFGGAAPPTSRASSGRPLRRASTRRRGAGRRRRSGAAPPPAARACRAAARRHSSFPTRRPSPGRG